MDKKTANIILSIFKLYFKTKPYNHEIYYDMTIPKSIASLGYDDNLLVTLMKDNLDNFDSWGKLNDNEIIIPTLKIYDIVTKFDGSESVVRKYSDRVKAYNEEHLTNKLESCEPCYNDGEEFDVEWYHSEGDWELESVEQITEEDINRIVKKLKLL